MGLDLHVFFHLQHDFICLCDTVNGHCFPKKRKIDQLFDV